MPLTDLQQPELLSSQLSSHSLANVVYSLTKLQVQAHTYAFVIHNCELSRRQAHWQSTTVPDHQKGCHDAGASLLLCRKTSHPQLCSQTNTSMQSGIMLVQVLQHSLEAGSPYTSTTALLLCCSHKATSYALVWPKSLPSVTCLLTALCTCVFAGQMMHHSS